MDELFLTIENSMAELLEEELLDAMQKAVEGGKEACEKALESCQKGMERVGGLFEEGEYFVGDLIYAGEIMTSAVEIISPLLGDDSGAAMGKMLIATVQNDLHDIGKNIVKTLLTAGGFDVLDLGTDVEPEAIVAKAKEENIKIIALSGVLSLSIDSMKAAVEAFEKAGLRSSVKIIIGGLPVSEAACQSVGADEWAKSPQKTVNVCRKWAQNE